MNAIAAPKSSAQNRLEGFVLTALFQGLPTFATAALLLKLVRHDISGGPVLFVVLTSILHALLTPWLAPKFPKFFRNGYEPLFFDASLSFAEKIEKWRMQPVASLQLVTTVLMLSLLGVGVASIH
jgi:phosphatidylserine synthase